MLDEPRVLKNSKIQKEEEIKKNQSQFKITENSFEKRKASE
jgi:hypothetical protein